MLNRTDDSWTETGALRLTVVETNEDADAMRKAGVRSVRVINSVEDVTCWDRADRVLKPEFHTFSEILIATRRGSEDLRDDLALRFGDVKCKWVVLPSGIGSPTALLARDGADGLSQAVSSARPMWNDEVSRLSDIPDPGVVRSYKCGIEGLDRHGFRIVRPCFWPIIGPYGSGKSILARQLVANFWNLYGWRTLITALEEKVKPRMQRDFRLHFGGDTADADSVIEKALLFLRRPRREEIDADRLFDRIEYAVHVYKIDCVVIDPVNEIDHKVAKGESKSDYMGRFMMRMKALADDYNLVVMVLAHPPKDAVSHRNSGTKIYTLNDGADTAHYGNKADIGWCVWRPMRDIGNSDRPTPTFLNIDKTKDHDVMGKPTLATLALRNGQFEVDLIGMEVMNLIAGAAS